MLLSNAMYFPLRLIAPFNCALKSSSVREYPRANRYTWLLLARVPPRQPVHLAAVVVGIDPHHHDFVLVQRPVARRRRRVTPVVVKPLRVWSGLLIVERQRHPRLILVAAVAHVPARLVFEQAHRPRRVIDL